MLEKDNNDPQAFHYKELISLIESHYTTYKQLNQLWSWMCFFQKETIVMS
jgi:hypothetical protein